MATGVVSWSKTAATNASSDSACGMAEGMAPSAVNDGVRGLMASGAKWRDDLNGSIATGGTSTALTVTTNQVFAALTAGYEVTFQIHTDCGATVTLNVDGLGAKPLRSAPAVELVAAALKSGSIHRATYATSNSGEWLLHGVDPTIIAASQVVTASINDAAVTLAKMENRAANKLIGRYTASTGVPQEVTVSTGLLLDTTTGNLTAPAFPPAGAFKNLSIKVASNTTITVAADYFTTTNGSGSFQTTAVSSTVNLGTTGVDALIGGAGANGTVAIDTFYHLWAIVKTDGTTKVVAATSSTADATFLTALGNLASGAYTYYGRMGAVLTIHASATLFGTWQLGRRAQYVVGLAQTTTARLMDSGTAKGSISVPTWVAISTSLFVPSTASVIFGSINALNGSGGSIMAAPNNSYAGIAGATNPPPVSLIETSTSSAKPFNFLLESTNIYWAATSTGSGSAVVCLGWEDNI